MLINRRTYRILPGHWDQAMELALHMRQLTRDHLQRDYEILIPRYGPYRTICFEFHLIDEVDELKFFHEHFYPVIGGGEGIERWFTLVNQSDSFNYRTGWTNIEVQDEIAHACRLGMLIHRQLFLRFSMNIPGFWDAITAIKEETRNQFQREGRFLTGYHAGLMGQLWIEFDHANHEDLQRFEEAWRAHMTDCGLLEKLDAEIGQGYNELWYSLP